MSIIRLDKPVDGEFFLDVVVPEVGTPAPEFEKVGECGWGLNRAVGYPVDAAWRQRSVFARRVPLDELHADAIGAAYHPDAFVNVPTAEWMAICALAYDGRGTEDVMGALLKLGAFHMITDQQIVTIQRFVMDARSGYFNWQYENSRRKREAYGLKPLPREESSWPQV